ncbi:MAG: CAP domain-containing protein [Planctomycetota bacterium]|jgi:hypothetical protein
MRRTPLSAVRLLSFCLAAAIALALTGCGGGSGDDGGVPTGGGTTGATITDADLDFNLAQLNALRATVGAPALSGRVMATEHLDAFALGASVQLMTDHVPHGAFVAAVGAGTLCMPLPAGQGFVCPAAENQGDPNGWPPASTVQEQISQILAAMWAEGPGGPHYDTIANPAYTQVGIGLVLDGAGRLYLTNDFDAGP